jgi:hypothetical protein
MVRMATRVAVIAMKKKIRLLKPITKRIEHLRSVLKPFPNLEHPEGRVPRREATCKASTQFGTRPGCLRDAHDARLS